MQLVSVGGGQTCADEGWNIVQYSFVVDKQLEGIIICYATCADEERLLHYLCQAIKSLGCYVSLSGVRKKSLGW